MISQSIFVLDADLNQLTQPFCLLIVCFFWGAVMIISLWFCIHAGMAPFPRTVVFFGRGILCCGLCGVRLSLPILCRRPANSCMYL